MCTAAVYKTKDVYFGRNLDHDMSYGEEVVVTPRNFPFTFRKAGEMKTHYAFIGMAFVAGGYPLYYDGTNEKGLSIAGLNFVGNAVYREPAEGKHNVAQFELIPWLLGQCACLEDARELLKDLNIVNIPFRDKLPLAELHWLIADGTGAIVVESVEDGIHVYEDPAGVLTNNPPFPIQRFALNNYRGLNPETPDNTFSKDIDMDVYCKGIGAFGLPGDLTSQSRFIRAAFTCRNSVSGEGEEESVGQFFHILHSVEQTKGVSKLGEDRYEVTLYTSCCNADKGIYYYTTYNNNQITAVDMHKTDLDSAEIFRYPVEDRQSIFYRN